MVLLALGVLLLAVVIPDAAAQKGLIEVNMPGNGKQKTIKENKMKKIMIFTLAGLLVVVFTVPASAELENTFGGYWRTRFFTNQDFNGVDDGAKDINRIDTRSRLYYTAKFSDNLKFVNKFEMDAVWGKEEGEGDSFYGDLGADGVAVEYKNAYVDMNLGDTVNAKLGVLGGAVARGYVFDSDFAGASVTFKTGTVDIPMMYIKFFEGGKGSDPGENDTEGVAISPSIKIGDGMTIKPFVMYTWSDNFGAYPKGEEGYEDLSLLNFGGEYNGSFGPVDFGLLGVMQSGSLEGPGQPNIDYQGYVVNVTAGFNAGPANIHLEGIYASDDYFTIPGHSVYWSEIMGYGTFDAASPAIGDAITNVVAGNVGATFTVMENIKLSLDLWHAQLAEKNENGDDSVGTEFDVKATIPVVENLKLDLVAAYLAAGDVIGNQDPIELGARFSLKF